MGLSWDEVQELHKQEHVLELDDIKHAFDIESIFELQDGLLKIYETCVVYVAIAERTVSSGGRIRYVYTEVNPATLSNSIKQELRIYIVSKLTELYEERGLNLENFEVRFLNKEGL